MSDGFKNDKRFPKEAVASAISDGLKKSQKETETEENRAYNCFDCRCPLFNLYRFGTAITSNS